MFGIFRKKNIVVMDASDWTKLNGIVGIARMMVGKKNVTDLRNLDSDHPTMKVIELRTSNRRFEELQNVLDEAFPALCTFNATL